MQFSGAILLVIASSLVFNVAESTESTTLQTTTVGTVEEPKTQESVSRLTSGGVDINSSPSANNITGPTTNKTAPKSTDQPATTPTPGPANSGANLLNQPITIVACFLVAMALKH